MKFQKLSLASFSLVAFTFAAQTFAASDIGPLTVTGDPAKDSIEVGNRLAKWVDGEYRNGGMKANTKAIAHVKHIDGNTFAFDGTISFAQGSVQTLCKVPATEIAMTAELSRSGALDSYRGVTKAPGCTVMAELNAYGNLRFGVSECEAYCVGGSREGGHDYTNNDIQKKWTATVAEIKNSNGSDLEAELARKQAAAASAAAK